MGIERLREKEGRIWVFLLWFLQGEQTRPRHTVCNSEECPDFKKIYIEKTYINYYLNNVLILYLKKYKFLFFKKSIYLIFLKYKILSV